MSTCETSDMMRHVHSFTVRSAADVTADLLSGLQLRAIYAILRVGAARVSRCTYNCSRVRTVGEFCHRIPCLSIVEENPQVGAYASKMIPTWRILDILDELCMRLYDLSGTLFRCRNHRRSTDISTFSNLNGTPKRAKVSGPELGEEEGLIPALVEDDGTIIAACCSAVWSLMPDRDSIDGLVIISEKCEAHGVVDGIHLAMAHNLARGSPAVHHEGVAEPSEISVINIALHIVDQH